MADGAFNDIFSSTVEGAGVVSYRFAFITGASANCAAATFNNAIPVETPLTIADLGSDDEVKTICLIGLNSAGAPQENASLYTWTKRRGAKLKPENLVKFTVDSAIIYGSKTTSDGNYGMSEGVDRRQTRSLYVDDKFYFLSPCKAIHNQKWSVCESWWDGNSATGAWTDGDAVVAGIQPRFSSMGKLNSDHWLGHTSEMIITADESGGIWGFHRLDNAPNMGTGTAKNMPFRANSYSTYTLASIMQEVGTPFIYQNQFHDALNDGSWLGTTHNLNADILVKDGVAYIYRVTSNAPTTPTIYYLSVVKSNDSLVSVQKPSTYIAENYIRPQVVRYGATYIMIALNTVVGEWFAIHGTGPETFDFANAINLGLRPLVGASGSWDELNTVLSTTWNEVAVFGVELKDDTIHIFYRAGDDGFGAGLAPYSNGARGFGVFKVKLDRN